MPGVTTAYQTGVHGSRPAASAGCILYSCTTHNLVYRSDGTTWTTWLTFGTGTSSTTIANDTIWAAAGDIAVATGNDAAAVLGIGAVGGHLSRINGVVAWDSGTSNPGSAASGDRFYRSDLNLAIKYDGTRWICMCDHIMPLPGSDALLPLSATAGGFSRNSVPYTGVLAIAIVRVSTSFEVAGGTALSGSHKWVGTLSDDGGTIATVNIDSGASDTQRNDTQIVSSIRASTSKRMIMGWTKTGTPGSLYVYSQIYFRLIVT